MQRMKEWWEARTGASRFLEGWLTFPVPGGARWRNVWGVALAFVFLTQCLTGFCLWAVYSPSIQTAWESVFFIQHSLVGGWFLRGLHHYAAHAMMVLLGINLLQMVIYRAYRAPRELNFWLALLVILPLTMVLSQTGYLLPWDQRGFYGTQVATTIVGSSPGFGPELQLVAQGSGEYGQHTLTRLFAIHAGLLPALLAIAMIVYACLSRRNRPLADTPREIEATVPYWPLQARRDAVVCLAVMLTIVWITLTQPVHMTPPADPTEEFPSARPEWYFLFLYRFLRFEVVEHWGLAFGAIYVPTFVIAVIAAMPWIGRWRLGHAFNIAFTLGVFGAIFSLTALAYYEDARNPVHQAALHQAEIDTDRLTDLALHNGIPAVGALSLLKQDPLTQGPRLFDQNCSSCHRFVHFAPTTPADAAVATSKPVEDQTVAPELTHFGSREWARANLVDFAKVFEPTTRIKNENGDPDDRFVAGDMANWSAENRDVLLKPTNGQSLAALVEFLVSQSQRPDLMPFDADLVKAGRLIFETGELADGALSSTCIDCHSMHAVGEAEALADNSGSGAPTLTGYGSTKWLIDFLRDPAHADFYGEKNAMPAFESQLTKEQLQLISRWMAHDYWVPESHVAE